MNDFGLYVIVTEPLHPLEKIAEVCVRYDVKMLQLRNKYADAKEILSQGKTLQNICAGSQTKVILNDRADLALAGKFDGLHTGQDDLGIPEIRQHFPKLKDTILGYSTHSLEQAQAALKEKPDYIGFGPVYPTFAKKKPDPAVGCGNLEEVLGFADVPVVAIGGINSTNIDEVLKSGAKNIAMISALMKAKDLEEEVRIFTELLR